MKRFILLLVATALLGGCATMTTPPASTDSALVIGVLRIDASGIGTAPNGANGFLNTNVPENLAVTLQNETTGRVYEVRTEIPSGFFALPNVDPGTYKLVQLWAQLKGTDSYFTLISSFDKPPTFDIAAGHVANLGITRWAFAFDLTRTTSNNSFTFNSDFPNVAAALSRMDAQQGWSGRQADQVSFSGQVTATPAVYALPPRNSAFDRILLP